VKEHGPKVARKIACKVALGLHEGNLSCEQIDCEGVVLYEGEKTQRDRVAKKINCDELSLQDYR
jgi:hypothetical protein